MKVRHPTSDNSINQFPHDGSCSSRTENENQANRPGRQIADQRPQEQYDSEDHTLHHCHDESPEEEAP